MQRWKSLSAVLSVILMTGFLLIYFQGLIKPVVIGALLALLLLPLCHTLENHGFGRGLALFSSMIIFILFFSLISTLFARQATNIGYELPGLVPRLETKLDLLRAEIELATGISPDDQFELIKKNVKELSRFSGKLFNQILHAAGGVLSLALSLFYMILFLLYRAGILRFLLMATAKNQEQTSVIVDAIRKMMRNYFRGVFSVMLIVAALNSIGLWAIGVKHPIFFGFLSAMMSVIPYVGIIASGSLCVFYAWISSDDPVLPLLVIGVFYGVQLLEGNILTPFITGGSAKINALATLFGLLLGSAIWGITGMIIAIPILATTKIICDHVPEWKAVGFLIGEELTSGRNKTKRIRKKPTVSNGK